MRSKGTEPRLWAPSPFHRVAPEVHAAREPVLMRTLEVGKGFRMLPGFSASGLLGQSVEDLVQGSMISV